jgi:uncharacterized protein
MHVSTYTLRMSVEQGEQTFLYNPLTGSMDLAEKDAALALDAIAGGRGDTVSEATLEYLLKRGYVYPSRGDELKALQAGYAAFAEMDRRTPLRFIIVPTYDCNARCKYCFVHELIGAEPLMDDDTMDHAFSAMDKISDERGNGAIRQLVLFGGEPFIDRPEHRRVIERILRMAHERDFRIDAVSNGFDLVHYVEMLVKYGFSKVQVTFDGPAEYANKRRPAVDRRGSSFQRIVTSVDAALEAGIQINARLLLDKTSIKMLPDLVSVMKEKGWFDHPDFSSHVGSVHDCFSNLPERETANHLKVHAGNRQLVQICRENPEIADLVGIDWHGARTFMQSGMLFPPSYKTCAGATRTFAFDLYGGIYICETTVGKPECRVGSFSPTLQWNEQVMSWFEQRNLLTLDECQSCNQALFCAGGCPFTGQVKGGTLQDLGCRAMKETLEYGLNYYWPQIRERMGLPPSASAASVPFSSDSTYLVPESDISTELVVANDQSTGCCSSTTNRGVSCCSSSSKSSPPIQIGGLEAKASDGSRKHAPDAMDYGRSS